MKFKTIHLHNKFYHAYEIFFRRRAIYEPINYRFWLQKHGRLKKPKKTKNGETEK